MKSIAGSIIVLSGAIIAAFSEKIPSDPFPTLSSLILMGAGLFFVFRNRKEEA